MTLRDFIDLSMDDFYKINIFYINTGVELVHQKEVGEIIDYFEENALEDLIDADVMSWDIDYYKDDDKEELCLNIDR